MPAAIYARKSTDQSGVADDQKSVARQIEHARPYAERKGWFVSVEDTYVDDGISGAEFANRPGFLRLMNALKPKAPLAFAVYRRPGRGTNRISATTHDADHAHTVCEGTPTRHSMGRPDRTARAARWGVGN